MPIRRGDYMIMGYKDFFRFIVHNHDLFIEGGPGNFFTVFRDIRELGYEGPYVAINNTPCKRLIPKEVSYVVGNCFDKDLIAKIIEEKSSSSPVFVTKNFLYSCSLRWMDEQAVRKKVEDLSSTKIRTQVHHHPTVRLLISEVDFYAKEQEGFQLIRGIYITGPRQECKQLKDFLEFSKEFGWKSRLGARDILFMKRRNSNIS